MRRGRRGHRASLGWGGLSRNRGARCDASGRLASGLARPPECHAFRADPLARGAHGLGEADDEVGIVRRRWCGRGRCLALWNNGRHRRLRFAEPISFFLINCQYDFPNFLDFPMSGGCRRPCRDAPAGVVMARGADAVTDDTRIGTGCPTGEALARRAGQPAVLGPRDSAVMRRRTAA